MGTAAQQQTILIIDDDENDVLITRRALLKIDPELRVEAILSGEAALNILLNRGEHPALILLDLKMPGMSGFDILRRIRADGRLKDLPVVVVTSSALDADKKASHEAGADGFILKAFEDRFRRDIESVLKRWLKD